MSKITPETARRIFMTDFARMSSEKQDGVIEGLMVIRDARVPVDATKDKDVVPTAGREHPA